MSAAVRSVRRTADDGVLCVLRVAVEPASALDRDPVALRVASGGGVARVMPVEASAEPLDDVVEFLVPSSLAGHAPLELELGDEVLPLPPAAEESRRAGAHETHAAYLALHAQIEDQAARLERLRRDLRAERDRAGRAEEAAAGSSDAAGARAAKLQRELDDVDERRARLASEAADLQSLLDEERHTRAAAEARVAELEGELVEARERAEATAGEPVPEPVEEPPET